jgi:hypothetical protein
MTCPGSEDFLAAEIDDVTTASLVGAPQVLLELLRSEIPQHANGAICLQARDFPKFVQRQHNKANAGPATTRPR